MANRYQLLTMFSEEEIEKDIGLIVYGSGNMTDFMNAFYALNPWDECYRPDYYADLLVSSDKKPKNLLYNNEENRLADGK